MNISSFIRIKNFSFNFLSLSFLSILFFSKNFFSKNKNKKINNFKNVAWFGAYGNNNLGDDLIFFSLKRMLFNSKHNIDLSIRNQKFLRNYGCNTFEKGENIYHFWKYLKIIKKTDIVIVGGGGLFEFYYPCWSAYKMIIIYLCPIMIAKIYNKPAIIMGVGVHNYKYTNFFMKHLFRVSLNSAHKILTRDEKSKIGLLKNGVNTKIISSFDPVLSLNYSHLKINSKKVKNIAVLLWPYFLWPHFYKNSKKITKDKILKHQNFIKQWKEMEDSLKDKYKFNYLTFHFSDTLLYKELNVKYSNFSQLNSLYNGIKKSDLIISMRYHGIITSINFNKPVISLNVQEKMATIMDNFKLDDFNIDITDFNSQILSEKISLIDNNYVKIKDSIINTKNKVNQQILSDYNI